MADACLVVLTDPLYLRGTLVLLDSWKRRNPTLPVVALSPNAATLEDPRLAAASDQRHLIDREAYRNIPLYRKRRSQRHRETFPKFEAFRDFGFQRNVFLDSDLLCLGPAPLLYRENAAPLLACLDAGFRKTRSYKGHPHEINSGVLSIHRSLLGDATVDALKTLAAQEPGRGGYNAGDQSVINKWIHRASIDLALLPPSYNLLRRDYRQKDDLDDCRLLHFLHRKPWFPPNGPRQALETLWDQAAAAIPPASQ